MMIIIFFSTLLMILGAVWISFYTAQNANGDLLMGIHIPLEYQKEEKVQDIIRKYHKSYTSLLVIFGLFSFLIFGIKWISFLIFYSTIWCGILFWSNQKVFAYYSKKLYDLKCKQGWFCGEKKIITVDTIVSQQKYKMPISKYWFLIPIFLTIFLFGIWIQKDRNAAVGIISITNMLITTLFLVLYHIISHTKLTVYSENSEVNYTINRMIRREWTKCILFSAITETIGNIVLCWYLIKIQKTKEFIFDSKSIFLIIVVMINIMISIFLILRTYYKIRTVKNQLLCAQEQVIQADDDIYWIEGYYKNPDDPHVLVEKRVGFGWTVNMATVAGKLSDLFLLGILFFIIGLGIYMLQYDLAEINLSIEQEEVKIEAASYNYTFLKQDIEQVELIEKIPSISKTKGFDSSKFYFGRFYVTGYGGCQVYIYRNKAPFIVIKLSDTFVFFNAKTEKETEQYYKQLINLL